MPRWYPENAARRKAWARIQADWAKAGQRDFSEIWSEPEPPKSSEAEDRRAPRPSPAPLAGPRPPTPPRQHIAGDPGIRRGKQ